MSSDSSTEDEEITKLREALDGALINNSMYSNLNQDVTKQILTGFSKNTKYTEIIEKQISRRPDKNYDQYKFNNLNVTPEFQNFVSKNLTKLLDSKIELYNSNTELKKTHEDFGGIKLFSNSTIFLKDDENYNHDNLKQNYTRCNEKKRKIIDEMELDAKIKAVVVFPNDILSKKSTLFWSKRTKRKPFNYKKLSNGKLELIE